MIRELIILGSTGSIGETTLKIIRRDKKKFKLILLSSNRNIKKIYKQAIEFKVNKIVIYDQTKLKKYQSMFDKKKIKVFHSISDALKNKKKKVDFTVSAISGLDGLIPTLDVIKKTKKLGIANKESIICGWKFIQSELKKNKTSFVPLDSEHFSIWSLLKNQNYNNVKKIYLTASGGPFLNSKLYNVRNASPNQALKHPNWKMGKKISIDSATMMNKIFEIIEAKKIFNMDTSKFQILIHPQSYVHAIVHFKTGLTKFLAHETTMEIPIMNALYENKKFEYNNTDFNYSKLNGTNFLLPSLKNFPLLNILNYKFNNSYFEVILVTLNDILVNKYLENKIKYISIHNILLQMLKRPYFVKYYIYSPKNIYDIKNMVEKVHNYMNSNLKVI